MRTNEISASFFVAPSRPAYFIEAVNSLMQGSFIPEQISAYFNPINPSEDLNKAIDLCSSLGISKFEFQEFQSLSKLWNHSIKNSNSEYHLLSSDDVIFEPFAIKQIIDAHKSGAKIVKGAEAFCSVSLSKNLINSIGLFDENFVWSWEDADYRLRLCKFGVIPYEITPYPITHLRIQADRNDEYWDRSSDYFFKKWNVAKLLVDLGILEKERELNAEERRSLLMNGFFNDGFYENYSRGLDLR
jgi:hypothetical protein